MPSPTRNTTSSIDTNATIASQNHNNSNTINVIKGEIHNILSILRHARKDTTNHYHAKNNSRSTDPLWSSFRKLNEELNNCVTYDHQTYVDSYAMVRPFVQAVTTTETNAELTGAALTSLHKFLLYNFVLATSPSAQAAVTLIAKSIRQCTFQASADGGDEHGNNYEEEIVVMKLLALSSLVVRCNAGLAHLRTKEILDIFSTCVHVSKQSRASPLLKSAAGDSLKHIVLTLCVNASHKRLRQNESRLEGDLVPLIMKELVELLRPTSSRSSSKSDDDRHYKDNKDDNDPLLPLTLINVALETLGTSQQHSPAMIDLLVRGDMCKHLVLLSTSRDHAVLTLTLRVIFNLFNGIKDPLKVQLEVFLTSVHLRILSSSNNNIPMMTKSSYFQRRRLHEVLHDELFELALESLLEFCQEPALMQDLYVNYDCDVHCSNLFEQISTTLARVAVGGIGFSASLDDGSSISSTSLDGPSVSAKNFIAMEGILAIVDSIARKCHFDNRKGLIRRDSNESTSSSTSTSSSSSSILRIMDSRSLILGRKQETEATDNDDEEDKDEEASFTTSASMILQQQRSTEQLKAKKLAKRNLYLAVEMFNDSNSTSKTWLSYAKSLNVITDTTNPKNVAEFLFESPGLDHERVGLYLSKGPHDKYPFIKEVLHTYAGLFQPIFVQLNDFGEALRYYLSKFRLPGEAQCIDRLMEAFAKVYFITSNGIFLNEDACYVLAFSTIMLNTDLHNPNLKKRMSCDDFIRNNRGINDGDDLPLDFLQALYKSIRCNPFKFVHSSTSASFSSKNPSSTSLTHADESGDPEQQLQHSHAEEEWDENDVRFKSLFVATPAFTPDHVKNEWMPAENYERDMLVSIKDEILHAMSSFYCKCSVAVDHKMTCKVLHGLQQMIRVAIYFNDDELFNEVLTILLEDARDYLLDYVVHVFSSNSQHKHRLIEDISISMYEELSRQQRLEDCDSQNSWSALQFIECSTATSDTSANNYNHRGLLSLHYAFIYVIRHPTLVREAWPLVVDCMFALRDGQVFTSAEELDDFADSSGTLLRPTMFQLRCRERWLEYMTSANGYDGNEKVGKSVWENFSLVLAPVADSENIEDRTEDVVSAAGIIVETNLQSCLKNIAKLCGAIITNFGNISESHSLNHHTTSFSSSQVTDHSSVDVDNASSSHHLIYATNVLNALLNATDPNLLIGPYVLVDSPLFEHHAVFALELASRVILCHRHLHAKDLYQILFHKLRQILLDHTKSPPYLMERACITILRACIHMFDLHDVRPSLMTSLEVMVESLSNQQQQVASHSSSTGCNILEQLSSRLACGMAIILMNAYFSSNVSFTEWNLISKVIELSGKYVAGRKIILDGIASILEYSDSSKNEVGLKVLLLVLQKFFFRFPRHQVELLSSPEHVKNKQDHLDENFVCSSSMDLAHGLFLKSLQYNFATTSTTSVLNIDELWLSLAKSYYDATLASLDSQSLSIHSINCLQKHVVCVEPTNVISASAWLELFQEMTNRRPVSLTRTKVRTIVLVILSRSTLLALPKILQDEANSSWNAMAEVVKGLAAMIKSNISGRKDGVLYESTVQHVTNMVNVMELPGFDPNDTGFGVWASEVLSSELEAVGAASGIVRRNGLRAKEHFEHSHQQFSLNNEGELNELSPNSADEVNTERSTPFDQERESPNVYPDVAAYSMHDDNGYDDRDSEDYEYTPPLRPTHLNFDNIEQ